MLRDLLTWTGLAVALDIARVEGVLAAAPPPQKLARIARNQNGPIELRRSRVSCGFSRSMLRWRTTMPAQRPSGAWRSCCRAPSQRGVGAFRRDCRDGRQPLLAPDPAARELHLLWELAGDLDRLTDLTAGRGR